MWQLVFQTWTLVGEHWAMAKFSREKKWSMSSREHDVGSARNSVADSEAFATASSAEDAMMLLELRSGVAWAGNE
jgi:hypothetical protein